MTKKKNNEKAESALLEQYISSRSLYKKCTEKFKSLINDLINESNIEKHSITARTKDVESVSKKISGTI